MKAQVIYKTRSVGFSTLICDNGTLTINVPTPKGWKCKKKGCSTKVKHTHSTYTCLKKVV